MGEPAVARRAVGRSLDQLGRSQQFVPRSWMSCWWSTVGGGPRGGAKNVVSSLKVEAIANGNVDDPTSDCQDYGREPEDSSVRTNALRGRAQAGHERWDVRDLRRR